MVSRSSNRPYSREGFVVGTKIVTVMTSLTTNAVKLMFSEAFEGHPVRRPEDAGEQRPETQIEKKSVAKTT